MKDDFACLDSRVTALETDLSEQKQHLESLQKDLLKVKSELECLQKALSAQREQSEYIESKLDFQKRLMRFYKEKVLKVSPMPMQPEGNETEVADVYVKPRMTVRKKGNDKYARLTDVELTSMSEIFAKDGKHMNSVYVVGETGMGKSFFSKSLVHFWCLAHADNLSTEDSFDCIKEMSKFEFLFHISLRRYSSTSTVKEMLEEEYFHPTLAKILDKESGNCLIVLDGLDEWATQEKTPKTKSFPKRDFSKEYTVITTSRPWKIETLQQSDAAEIKQRIELVGIHSDTRMDMITNTLSILNETFGESKSKDDCVGELEETGVSDIMHVPIVLQQLVCLWFDGKLSGTSSCTIYSGMLDLYFSWSSKRIPGDPDLEAMRKSSDVLSDVELPQHLSHSKLCKRYKIFIYYISSLAFETLVNENKELSLTFDGSTMERLGIKNEVQRCCLKLGILTEKCSAGFSSSKPQKSLFSFVHKSLQEFLAAVYVAVNFNSLTHALQDTQNTTMFENCMQFIQNYFGKIRMIEEILENANVFIILCGLEPRLSTYISKYIFDIVTVDNRVVKYRTKELDTYVNVLSAIQCCICRMINEVLANEMHCHPQLFLGDVIVDMDSCSWFLEVLKEEYIIVDHVLSLYWEIESDYNSLKQYSDFRYLSKCQLLSTMRLIEFGSGKAFHGYIGCISKTLMANVSTLQVLSFHCYQPYLEDCYNVRNLYPVIQRFLNCLFEMENLVALQIKNYGLTPEERNSLSAFLTNTNRLQQISLTMDYGWNPCGIDLSKHSQLQCLSFSNFTYVKCANTANFEVFAFTDVSNSNLNAVFDILNTCSKLTYLELECNDYFNETGSVTLKLISLLPSLPQLQELKLANFTVTDNIIMYSSEMKKLHRLELSSISLSRSTWYKIIDSLPMLPNQVEVKVWPFCITVEECRNFRAFRAEFRYVEEKQGVFLVKHRSDHVIEFTTQK